MIVGVIFLFSPFLYFFWLIWFWINRKSRDTRAFRANLIAATLLTLFVSYHLRILPGSQLVADRFYTKRITGKAFWIWEEYDLETTRAFNGDGYTMQIYSMSENAANGFIEPGEHFFEDYPNIHSCREKWEKKKWQGTPIKDDENDILDGAVWYGGGLEECNKHEKVKLVRLIMNEPDNFYAYNFYGRYDRYVANVDFYIISPKRRMFICINKNT